MYGKVRRQAGRPQEDTEAAKVKIKCLWRPS